MCGIKSLPLALRFQFGSRAFVVDEGSQHFEDRVHECLFLGYEKNKPQNCLRFYKLSNGTRISSTNFSIIDGMMMFNEDAVRFDDVLVTEPVTPVTAGFADHDQPHDDFLAFSDDEWDGTVGTEDHQPPPPEAPDDIMQREILATLDANIAQATADGHVELVTQLMEWRQVAPENDIAPTGPALAGPARSIVEDVDEEAPNFAVENVFFNWNGQADFCLN
jgi:hypothetical protein